MFDTSRDGHAKDLILHLDNRVFKESRTGSGLQVTGVCSPAIWHTTSRSSGKGRESRNNGFSWRKVSSQARHG